MLFVINAVTGGRCRHGHLPDHAHGEGPRGGRRAPPPVGRPALEVEVTTTTAEGDGQESPARPCVDGDQTAWDRAYDSAEGNNKDGVGLYLHAGGRVAARHSSPHPYAKASHGA